MHDASNTFAVNGVAHRRIIFVVSKLTIMKLEYKGNMILWSSFLK